MYTAPDFQNLEIKIDTKKEDCVAKKNIKCLDIHVEKVAKEADKDASYLLNYFPAIYTTKEIASFVDEMDKLNLDMNYSYNDPSELDIN